ncbi:cysteine desulfurase [Vallitalea pronyensis]|uniref:Cysteine desulfurase n=1 Tax=Vallitalea pronyensis TaxID=1348613 RepID=A0A8J8MLU1_9FIRM|nr:cysteine desulfurase family protein [Vallitalea pronyensis]QUI23871.1 cysteine desulfurase [Vallitalea pronyensis]
MEVYLDNGATTKTFDEVVEIMCNVLKEDYGNPSSLHQKGIDAENHIIKSKEIIAKILKVNDKEVYFTSGGTEANNLAILGIADAYKRSGKHIITTSLEHSSVKNTMLYLGDHEYALTILPVDQYGQVNLKVLQDTIREDTILVSMMYVNNELGTIIPVDKIGALIKNKNQETIFHVDAIQAFGKMVIYPKKWQIDLLSISGHKFHGPKGIGALYINDRIKINPISYGGNQQKGMRNGTENVPGIAAIGCAASMMYDQLEAHRTYLYELKSYLAKLLLEEIEGIQINGMPVLEGAPHILSVRIKGVRGEVLLHSLEEKNIYVSTGSACSSNKPSKTGPLQAIGLTNEEALSTVRFGLSVMNTKDELDICVKELKVMIPMLRKFVRH